MRKWWKSLNKSKQRAVKSALVYALCIMILLLTFLKLGIFILAITITPVGIGVFLLLIKWFHDIVEGWYDPVEIQD